MERLITQGDITLWTCSCGKPDGLPLLVFNGGPGCDDYLAPIAAMLEYTCRVIRFEPRGCGRSTWRGPYDLETTLADVEVIREAYRVPRWLVAGHSAGVDYAMAYGIAHPSRTQGLIGLSGGRIVNDRDWSASYHQRRDATPEDAGGKVFSSDPEVNRAGNLSWRAYIKRPDLLRDIANIPFPCVFINAGADIRDNWPTRQLARLIPRGRYVEIPGAGHMSWLSHRAEVEQELQLAVAHMFTAVS